MGGSKALGHGKGGFNSQVAQPTLVDAFNKENLHVIDIAVGKNHAMAIVRNSRDVLEPGHARSHNLFRALSFAVALGGYSVGITESSMDLMRWLWQNALRLFSRGAPSQ